MSRDTLKVRDDIRENSPCDIQTSSSRGQEDHETMSQRQTTPRARKVWISTLHTWLEKDRRLFVVLLDVTLRTPQPSYGVWAAKEELGLTLLFNMKVVAER